MFLCKTSKFTNSLYYIRKLKVENYTLRIKSLKSVIHISYKNSKNLKKNQAIISINE